MDESETAPFPGLRGQTGAPLLAAIRSRIAAFGVRLVGVNRRGAGLTEIRRLAIACLRQLADVAPAVFADFEVSTLADGTEVATSPLATEA